MQPINGTMDNFLMTEVMAHTPMLEQILPQHSGEDSLSVPHRIPEALSIVGVLECKMGQTENEERGKLLIGEET